MSDSIKELCKKYEENVAEPHARSVGLFTIPEYPEFEVERGMLSTALDAILTTLRYLAPATILTLLWGQQSFIFKLLKYIDSAIRALLFSNEEQKQAVLKWLSEYGLVRVDDLGTVWRQGWILCGVLDVGLPGACAGHPPTSLSLKHAQTIADHYLGVEPVFSRQELESHNTLSKHQEWKLTTYIDRIRQALMKVTPPVTKASPQKTSPETPQFTLDYIARGSGLSTAQINKSMNIFKIYPTLQQSVDPGEIAIEIRGPEDTYGMKVLPPMLGKGQLIRQELLDLQTRKTITENVLPFAHGATYLRSYGKNDMTKTYYIPKTKYDIEIEVESKPDYIRIGYIANLEGKYEISITSKGQNIVGSPYILTASKNIMKSTEKDSFCLEKGEEIDIVDGKSDRKVVLRIVDFVSEKMLLKDDGVLERISEDEAKYLMENDIKVENFFNLNTQNSNNAPSVETIESHKKCKKFNEVAKKVLKINKVCKSFYNFKNEKEIVSEREDQILQPKIQQDIPDIVNSTLSEATVNPFILSNNYDKFIVPENISVSILTEKTELSETDCDGTKTDIDNSNKQGEINLAEFKILRDCSFEDSVGAITLSSNPFLNDSINEDNVIEKSLGTFVTSEFETNKPQNEEAYGTKIKIIVDATTEISPLSQSNPFIDPDISQADRPKSPVFKIISGDHAYQEDLMYIDTISNSIKYSIDNEFINPFLTHQHLSSSIKQNLPVTDFIIGAPVSLPPGIMSLSLETDTKSFETENKKVIESYVGLDNENSSLQTNITNTKNNNSIDAICLNTNSNITDQRDLIEENVSPTKEMWDSAYVSIDENNTSPDTNNNDNNASKELQNKEKYLNSYPELSSMGPAEREIWLNCEELKENGSNKIHDEISKFNKWDLTKSIFTPIIEESITNISLGMKGLTSETVKYTETDPVTTAFAEINDLYNDYFPSSEKNSTASGDKKNQSLEIHKNEYEDKYVKSASDNESDVMRHKQKLEGKISEIQALTESVSVSQSLHVDKYEEYSKCDLQNVDKIKFGDSKYNIVLEKKKYWDEKIKQIEAKAEESKAQQKKRRLSAKQLRHNDSLSKRRGKQIVRKYITANEGYQKQSQMSENLETDIKRQEGIINHNNTISHFHEDDEIDKKRVKNWKAYWDNKLEGENNVTCLKTTAKTQTNLTIEDDTTNENKSNSNIQFSNIEPSCMPIKQELPEEIFKAFETSPKRFFGTSRKQILSKIDTFLGKPNSVEEPMTDNCLTTYECGLVSSRISLFHNISQTEELSWSQRKSQSMLNLYRQKDSEREINDTPDFGKSTFDAGQNVNTSQTLQENHQESKTETIKNITTLKEKRARITDKFYIKSFDETCYHRSMDADFPHQDSYVQKTIKLINRQHPNHPNYSNYGNIRKISSSKSEMDIFNKFTNKSLDEDFDKHKSYDELPKVSVKNFISLYEDVSKKCNTNSMRISYNRSPEGSEKRFKSASSITGTAHNDKSIENCVNFKQNTTPENSDIKSYHKDPTTKKYLQNSPTNRRTDNIKTNNAVKKINEISVRDFEKGCSYISLSDIDLEIVEKCSEKSIETPLERDMEIAPTDYKSRFKTAKQYFQSLEELREVNKPNKLNECELLLYNKSTESPTKKENKQNKRFKKKTKSHTMPSSEISEFWNQLKEQQNENKLIKISEKFNVEDLFTDVMDGRFSRQGSFRGIPHKKAVLEAFRSMENISDNRLSPYELAVSQLSDFAKENKIKNAQTYLSEYPYLPTTDPSKYHSRLDANASGLISMKELLNRKVRRNSVPDLRMNPSFTVDL